jgi:hypothetical protein
MNFGFLDSCWISGISIVQEGSLVVNHGSEIYWPRGSFHVAMRRPETMKVVSGQWSVEEVTTGH